MDTTSIAFLAGAIIDIAPLYLVISKVRDKHSRHVFSLWYLYSTALISVSCLFAYIYYNAVTHGHPQIQGTGADIIVFLFDAALDIRGELYFVSAASAFLLVPQLLAYLVSGIFGCAHLPSALKWIDGFIAWGLIKFFIILAGIIAAQAIFAAYGHPYREPSDIPSRLFYMSLFLSVSFTIFAFYYARENILHTLDRLGLRNGLRKIHHFMTRYANERTSETSKDSLEEMIFDSLSQWLLARLVKLIARKIRRHDQLQGV